MLPRDERNTDRDDAIRRRQLRPVSTIAIQDQTSRDNSSQELVYRTIEDEQKRIRINPVVQQNPGDLKTFQDNVEEIITTIPVNSMNPVRVVPRRTTISGRLKESMGVANIRARSRRGAIVERAIDGRTVPLRQASAVGTAVRERKVGDTPVGRLGWLDQFFNWINAIFS